MKHQLFDLATAIGALFVLAGDDIAMRNAAVQAEKSLRQLAEYEFTDEEEEVVDGGDPNVEPEVNPVPASTPQKSRWS